MDEWSIRRRLAAVGVVVALLAGLAWAWPTLDAYARATAVLGDAVLRLPLRPLAWVTPEPVTEELHWPDGGFGLLTRPGEPGQHPGIVLVLGSEPAEPDDPRVERLTSSLARTGLAVLLVRSEPLIDGRVTADEPALVVGAFEAMRGHPRIDPGEVGFVGLSVGGSLALVAAADPAIADEVAYVVAIGPYSDAGTLVANVAAGAYRAPDGVERWEPDGTAVRVVRNTLLTLLSEDERAAVTSGGRPASDDARAVQALLGDPSLERAHELVAALSPGAHAVLEAVSPSDHVAGLRAPLYLLHDRHDPFIPWPQSEAIAEAYEPEAYHLLDLFEHVDPALGDLDVLVRDGWRLLRIFAEIYRESR